LSEQINDKSLLTTIGIGCLVVGIIIGFAIGSYYYFEYQDKKDCVELTDSLTIYEMNRENYKCVLQNNNKITNEFVDSEWERLWEHWGETINECDNIDYMIRALAPFIDRYKNIERMTNEQIDRYDEKCGYPNPPLETPTFDKYFSEVKN